MADVRIDQSSNVASLVNSNEESIVLYSREVLKAGTSPRVTAWPITNLRFWGI